MKRKAFILTEILTGMMLQALFAITLCGAFYLILTFSTSTQQILAAHDQGQMVISYIDNRIRNAGVGLHGCENPAGVAKAFNIPTNMNILKDGNDNALPLPVAITSKIGTGKEVISTDDKIYEGNILVLLYAHKDNNAANQNDEAVVVGFHDESPDWVVPVNADHKTFKFININSTTTNFTTGSQNIKAWAVTEASGVPVRLSQFNGRKFNINAEYMSADMYPLSELLNLECQKMYAGRDASEGRSFIFGNIQAGGGGWDNHYHTKGILELYMRLDTNANPPIFDLKVLCDEGKSDEVTAKPNNWPAAYWYTGQNGQPDFTKHKVHVSQASWKLYNLAPLFY